MEKNIMVWYDEDSNYLEVLFESRMGYFRETDNEAVMEKVDEKGNIIGFSILGVKNFKEKSPLSINLTTQVA